MFQSLLSFRKIILALVNEFRNFSQAFVAGKELVRYFLDKSG